MSMGIRMLHISDIHGDKYYIRSISDVVRNVDAVIVSGDFEDPEVLDVLSNYGRPVYVVMGNMDPRALGQGFKST
ncbi:metallophosphoesterase family protein [Vulcanisaeta sp. JCM 14467]|uniref:metallophosphoesterase family protein n=1 Tax=Vulcanisaeta sp. JCM 14467 TaxID=1295370 RepID=UPI0006D1797B|nr:metallophosphoesterase family protein [Vulcanisaeta sp. JCM 14467]